MADIVILLALLGTGYLFGRIAETRHYRSILKREEELRDIPAVATRFPPLSNPAPSSTLVTGSVVISVDYFKRFVASLRNLVGGRVRTYETLVDRARREALLRMKEEARYLGADLIFNVKLETSSISKGARNAIGSVEVLAYGTALIPAGRERGGGAGLQ